MLNPAEYTISIPRNGDYVQDWSISVRNTADNGWELFDLTGCIVEMAFRKVAGQGSIIASATIDLHDPVNGQFTVTISGSDFSAIAGSSEIVTLAYDLAVTYPDTTRQIYVRGHALLIPGVS